MEQRGEKRMKAATENIVLVGPAPRSHIDLSTIRQLDIEPSWNRAQDDLQEVLNRCPCLEDWFDAFVLAEQPFETWKDRLAVLVNSAGVDIAKELVQEIDVGPGRVEVPTKLAWAMALDRDHLLGEEDFGRLMSVALHSDKVLNLAAVVTSLLGEQKLIISRSSSGVRVWLHQEDQGKKESILKWVKDTYAETQSKTHDWYTPTVIAAWLGDVVVE
jgi:hypothetical protein